MARSLLNATDRGSILDRIAQLTPSSTRQWGKMTVSEALCHMADGLVIAFGDKPVTFKPSLMSTGLVRWFIIYSPIPWPKGKVEAPPGFFDTRPDPDFETNRQFLVGLVRRFEMGENQRWGTSPYMGPLGAQDWAVLNFRHLDHHLRQFGV